MTQFVTPLLLIVVGLVIVGKSRGTLISSRVTAAKTSRKRATPAPQPVSQPIQTQVQAPQGVNPLGDIYDILGDTK